MLRTQRRLRSGGGLRRGHELGDAFTPLFRQVAESDAVPPLPSTLPPPYRFGDFLARIGRVTVHLVEQAGNLLGFVGLVFIVAARTIRHPSRLRVAALVANMEQTGVDALPIVGLLSFLIGVVFAFQGADQLRRLGAEIYTVNLLGVVILRELGVLHHRDHRRRPLRQRLHRADRHDDGQRGDRRDDDRSGSIRSKPWCCRAFSAC